MYVTPVLDRSAVIQDGPVLGGLEPAILESTDLNSVADCWELKSLSPMRSEVTALRLNALDHLARLERFVTPSGRLLDLGCGWGFFLVAAAERGWTPFGVEPLVGHAVYARAKCGATVVADILRDDTFPEGYFDVVTALQVFEHLPDPPGDLARLHRLMRPGGVVLIEVPNVDTWSVRLFGRRHRHFVPDHLTFFSKATLSLLLEAAGFEVVEAYFPARHMTLRHLLVDWGGRYLPRRAVRAATAAATSTGLDRRVVRLSFGDIVAVIGRRGP